MLLSIVIPTHNRAASLKECLEALVSSIGGRSECEIIVIDDNSRGDMASINKSLCREMRAGYWYLEKNQGAAIARNTGIKKAKGEWVALLDDDVCVENDWYDACVKAVSGLSPAFVGLEGMLAATGDGVWDKEVENLHGKAYLTCHIIYRKDTLTRIGGFDGRFRSRYPACEDHELALRALLWGDICFDPLLRARHLPRAIHGAAYLRDSFHRMKSLLDAEFYFFQKHRDRYHMMRHARTFWGTYKNIVFFHCLVSLKRRPSARLLLHPLQTITLVVASAVEQLTALCLLPKYVVEFFVPRSFLFMEQIDETRTRELWGMDPGADSSLLRCKPSFPRSLFFPFFHRPVYSIGPVLKRMKGRTSLSDMRVFLRIDDVFLNDTAQVRLLCAKLAERKIPFCAGVTGNDLGSGRARRLLMYLRQCGGEIALHGFTHSGKFGPYKSEILQMNFHSFDAKLRALYEHCAATEIPSIFIPPYNAISREQISYLTRYFKVICGGPETARFTDYSFGPVALENDAWYFPSFYPCYDNAVTMERSRTMRSVFKQKGIVCVTVHMPLEARDGYAALMRLMSSLAAGVTPWNYFFEPRRRSLSDGSIPRSEEKV